MYYVKSTLINSCGFIPYKRGDREDGALIKNIIVDKINAGTNILIFPEGTTTKNGIPQEFKNGIFHLAINNNLTILPITLKYALDIGWAEGESVNLFKWFDNHVDVYIHPPVDSGKELGFQTLKDKVFKTICEPVLKKVEPQGQT
jgi:1-acyl-sn-glycerol-3-phosphate acyltransferase